MVFPTIMPANSVSGFNITNSVRFNTGDNPKISKTPDASNRRTWSFSTWIKRASLGSNQRILGISNGGDDFRLRFTGNDTIEYLDNDIDSEIITTNVFRDTSAWYHILAIMDTTQGTASNRAKLYVNGVLQTSIVDNSGSAGGAFASQNADGLINSNVLHTVGCRDRGDDGIDQSLSGCITETHFIDGVAKAPTDFGEFDDNSVWVPISYTGSYGTEGWFFQFKQTGTSTNASGIGADTSGNGNHWAVTNLAATDIGTDSPTNNFCTLNTNDMDSTTPNITEGALDYHSVANTQFNPIRSTFAVTQGKWYAEWKYINTAGFLGVITAQSPLTGNIASDSNVRSIFRIPAGLYGGRNNSGGFTDVGDNSQTFSDNDIGQVALDMDNGYVYFGINGTYLKGQDGSTTGDPAGNNGGAGGAANHPSQLMTDQHDGTIALVAGDYVSGTTGQIQCNFGGGAPFAISSGNADAKGHGNFEFAVPSGFFALCSKNLAEFG